MCLSSLVESELSGRDKNPWAVFTCTEQFGEQTKAKQELRSGWLEKVFHGSSAAPVLEPWGGVDSPNVLVLLFLSQRSAWHSLSQRRACGPHSLAARWCSGFLLRAQKTHIRPSPSPQEEISRSWSWCTLLLECKFLVASQGRFSEGCFFSRGSSMLPSSGKSQQRDPAPHRPPQPSSLLPQPADPQGVPHSGLNMSF